MSKFYATCGSHSLVITAPNAQHAAMRLMDEVLGAHIWIYEDSSLSEQQRRDHLVLEALLHLAPEVAVSEIGIQRNEAGEFGVPELLEDWHRLMTAVSRLFVAAGLAPERVLPKTIHGTNSNQPTRQLPR